MSSYIFHLLSYYVLFHLKDFISPLPFILFTTQEITGCINEAAKGANKTPRNLPSFFVSCFTVSVTPSINTPESSNDFIVTAPFPLIFLSNLFFTLEVKLLIDPGKLFLAKGIAMFVSAFFPKLPNQEPKDSPY